MNQEYNQKSFLLVHRQRTSMSEYCGMSIGFEDNNKMNAFCIHVPFFVPFFVRKRWKQATTTSSPVKRICIIVLCFMMMSLWRGIITSFYSVYGMSSHQLISKTGQWYSLFFVKHPYIGIKDKQKYCLECTNVLTNIQCMKKTNKHNKFVPFYHINVMDGCFIISCPFYFLGHLFIYLFFHNKIWVYYVFCCWIF